MKDLVIHYISSTNQIVNIFTKHLAKLLILRLLHEAFHFPKTYELAGKGGDRQHVSTLGVT